MVMEQKCIIYKPDGLRIREPSRTTIIIALLLRPDNPTVGVY